jgi:GTPase SAR1 family protein
MAKKNYDLLFKLLLIGDSGVGKVSEQKNLIDHLNKSLFI